MQSVRNGVIVVGYNFHDDHTPKVIVAVAAVSEARYICRTNCTRPRCSLVRCKSATALQSCSHSIFYQAFTKMFRTSQYPSSTLAGSHHFKMPPCFLHLCKGPFQRSHKEEMGGERNQGNQLIEKWEVLSFNLSNTFSPTVSDKITLPTNTWLCKFFLTHHGLVRFRHKHNLIRVRHKIFRLRLNEKIKKYSKKIK